MKGCAFNSSLITCKLCFCAQVLCLHQRTNCPSSKPPQFHIHSLVTHTVIGRTFAAQEPMVKRSKVSLERKWTSRALRFPSRHRHKIVLMLVQDLSHVSANQFMLPLDVWRLIAGRMTTEEWKAIAGTCKLWQDLKPVVIRTNLPTWDVLLWASKRWGEAEAVELRLNPLADMWKREDLQQLSPGEEGSPAVRHLCLASPDTPALMTMLSFETRKLGWTSSAQAQQVETLQFAVVKAMMDWMHFMLEACCNLESLAINFAWLGSAKSFHLRHKKLEAPAAIV